MLSDKAHATEFSHFIKLFPYPIQNRDISNIVPIMVFVVYRAFSRCHLTRLRVGVNGLRRAWAYE